MTIFTRGQERMGAVMNGIDDAGEACVVEKVTEAIAAIGRLNPIRPRVGIVLGSGLGAMADAVSDATVIPYGEIPNWPHATAIGHAGRLIIGTLEGVPVAVMQGRVHYYEGYEMSEVVFPVRVLGKLGIETLIVTNATGGVNLGYRPGDLVAIYDHINFMGNNPLIGPNEEKFGPRFPDMTYPYDSEYLDLLGEAAGDERISLHRGVYMAVTGPSYETPAEIRMARIMGADVVGMSTVPEVIAANHMGLRVAAVSCVSNFAAGVKPEKLHHEEVLSWMAQASDSLTRLIRAFLRRMQ